METTLRLKSSIVQNAIELNGATNQQIRIYDSSGRLVGSTSNGHFGCAELENGIYFVRASSGEQFKVIKIQ